MIFMFNHIQHDIPKLVRVDSPEGRKYQTPSGKSYPSVTSVVGLLGKEAIREWRARVGEEEANRVSARAARRGTTIHSLCENYLLNKEVKPGLFDVETFDSIKSLLNRINNIHCLETQLFSDHLQVAGTVDCIAEFDGRVSVIDFKTSRRIKSREDIPGYFMQTSAYAVMFEELTRIPVDRLVIIMSVDDEAPLLFIEKRDDWIGQFIELRKDYSKLHNK
jgi:CRISPR/Cas system-associated exonuclease Cas4 (RecB family)